MKNFMNKKVYDFTWGQYFKACGIVLAIYGIIIAWITYYDRIKSFFKGLKNKFKKDED